MPEANRAISRTSQRTARNPTSPTVTFALHAIGGSASAKVFDGASGGLES
jgi:hypothetical protein